MSLTSALYNAGTGIASVSRYSDLVANNIANAQTAGYARRDLIVSEQVLAGYGVGVDTGVISRAEATYLTDTLLTTGAEVQKQSAINDSLSYLKVDLGDITSNNTLSSAMDTFTESMRDLAETPEAEALQHNTVLSAQDLSKKMNLLSASIQSLRAQADKQIAQQVETLNSDLSKLGSVLNDLQIYAARNLDTSPLLDQKDKLLAEIGQIVSIKTLNQSDGSMYIYTAEGSTILYDHGAKTVNFSTAFSIDPEDVYAASTTTVSPPYDNSLSGITVENGNINTDITPNSGLGTSISQGSLGGLFDLRDKILPEAQKQLDHIAKEMITAFRLADTTVGPNQDSLFTSTIGSITFTGAGHEEVGLAALLTVNSAFDVDQGGTASRLRDGVGAITQGPASNDAQLRAFVNALTTNRTFAPESGLSEDQSLASSAKDFITRQFNQISRVSDNLSAAQARFQTVQDTRDNIIGVNVDDETQKLSLLSQLYSANATVLKTIIQMFDTLLNSIHP